MKTAVFLNDSMILEDVKGETAVLRCDSTRSKSLFILISSILCLNDDRL